MEIEELTWPERRIARAFPRGETVDLRSARNREVRARVLRALLLRVPEEDGEIPALRLRGARVTGCLDLRSAVLTCPVSLVECDFPEPVVLYGAECRQLTLRRCRMPELRGTTMRVSGALRLSDCRVSGAVCLGGARVEGALFLERAVLGTEPDESDESDESEGRAPAPGEEKVLRLDHAVVGEDLRAAGLTVHGQARLDGLTVTGHIGFDDTRFLHPGGTALQAETVTVGTDLHCMRMQVRGRTNLRGATVPGQLNLAYARLSHPGGVALRASSCTAGEFWLRAAAPVEGEINLRRARFDLLHIAPAVWSGPVRLDGLAYTTLAPTLAAAERLQVLSRDEDGYIPFAYEQLTAAYRHIGDDAAARTVQLAKQRRHRTTLPLYARLWGHLQDATVGYGFRPMRAAGWLAGLLLLGTLAYGLHPPRPLNADEAPGFNAFAYALDLLLPIVDFGQEKAYAPQGWYQWLAYLLVVAGWVLATTFVAGVNRTVSRS